MFLRTHLWIAGFVYLLSLTICSAETIGQGWYTSPDKWTEPRIYHAPFEREYERRILISRVSRMETEGQVFSPNCVYWFSLSSPDFKKPGPWTTTLHVFNERSYLVEIRLVDHSPYEPAVMWINEKLLYVQVWWGRILGSYLVFDVEKETVVMKEMVHDGQIPFDQFQEMKKSTLPKR